MSLHFHPLIIKEVRQETADSVSLLFDVPEKLQTTYQFLPGQNLTLKTTLNGAEVRRSYSICSAPQDNELRVAIKKVEGGVFSNYANEQLKAGDTLEVMPPTGKFNTPLSASQTKRYLMIAAGSGITPILSLIKSILYTEPSSTITLVYGNRSRSSIIFFEELEQLKNKYMQRLNILHILSREKTDSPLQLGRIDAEKLNLLDRLIGCKNMDECFICGPEEMTLNSKAFLENTGLSAKKIHLELFTSSKIAAAIFELVKSSRWIFLADSPVFSKKALLFKVISSGPQMKHSSMFLHPINRSRRFSFSASMRPSCRGLSVFSRLRICRILRRCMYLFLSCSSSSKKIMLERLRLPYTKVIVLEGSVYKIDLINERMGVMPLPAAIIRYRLVCEALSGVLNLPVGGITSSVSPALSCSLA